MVGELSARTAEGAALVTLAEQHAAEFATRADSYDRDNGFVRDNVDAMRASGMLTATVPAEHGGLGVASLHDLAVAIARLARGCPATAIVANMHLGFVVEAARTWRRLVAAHGGNGRNGRNGAEAGRLALLLRLLGRGRLVAHAATEPGGNGLALPTTEAVRTPHGYLVNGHKTFVTNSAAADIVVVFLRIPDGPERYRHGVAAIRRGTPGMRVAENWDALGMRGSGSHDISFVDCQVPADMVRVGEQVGERFEAMWPGVLAVNFPLAACYLGIAEAAYEAAVNAARTRRRRLTDSPLAEWGAAQLQVAEMEVGLAAARASVSRTGTRIDAALGAGDAPGADETDRLVLDFQCTKLIVTRAAADIVERAMNLVGGGAYRTGHPLGRMYRDVRAGPFMQPYAPNEALEFIGRVSLGLDPYAELRGRVSQRV